MIRSMFVALTMILVAFAAHADDVRTISVQGIGGVAAKPDSANARAGIETRCATPDEALAANTKTMTALMTALKHYGVAERDIETSAFDVSPIYGQATPRGVNSIEGYQVINQVSVRVRDLSKLGVLLSSLVEAGANRLNGVSYEIADPAPFVDQARKAAIADARKRADLYAAAAGAKIKQVLSISEGSGYAPPMPVSLRAMKAGAEAVQVAGGEQNITVSVAVVYEID